MSKSDKLRIAIIGAGIGGLTLSAAIGSLKRQRDDLEVEVDIYEGASRLTEVGAGINFFQRSWEIMEAIGLDQKLLSYLPRAGEGMTRQYLQFRKGDQREGVFIADGQMEGGSYRFHRADVQQALLSAQNGCLHLSHRLISYEEKEEGIYLHFEGGAIATCDVLVGMDGINSVVRKCLLTSRGMSQSPTIEPVWAGDIAYRSLIPSEKLQAVFPGHRALTRPMLHLVSFPVAQNKLINFVAITAELLDPAPYDGPTATPCTVEEVQSIFKGWEPEAQALLQCMEKPLKWIIRYQVPLDRYALGHVVLGGDAAHSMTPYQSAGAGQAVEDAYILATLLCDKACNKETIPEIMEIYDAIRRPIGNGVIEKSRVTGRLVQLSAPGLEDIAEGDEKVSIDRLRGIVEEHMKSFEWVWKEPIKDDRERALLMLSDLEKVRTPNWSIANASLIS
ncbi:hypothetical protein CVT26_001320 [Gymnopilus dilepis]|uniref:FAD-binding domain-containing protein n=1 Tax=Gymnopilus dilepis TaxID=231916 RepID=A0A409YM80_9AGAR|nr:hypothetical protein CVT26_001320 [Gymnopilus dilepis]